MFSLSLKRAVSPSFLFLLLSAAVALSIAATPARAMGMTPYGAYTCGNMCMSNYGGVFGPFMGSPFVPMTPGYGAYYQTGQWGGGGMMGNSVMQDPRYAMAQQLQWSGTQPLGLSYMPPIGMSAIRNDVAGSALGF